MLKFITVQQMKNQADTDSANKKPKVFSYNSLSSTNDKMKELTNKEDLPEFTIVITKFQTAGRGQEGNSWESLEGENLTFSILLRPDFLEPQDQFFISKVISLAIVRVLTDRGIDAMIKWPNDIYAGDKKIAGILIENELMGNSISISIAGIGLNVNQTVFTENAGNAVSMRNITGREYKLNVLLNDLVNEVIECYNYLRVEEFQLLNENYFMKLLRRTGFHKYRDEKGEFLAEIAGIESSGILILRDKKGKERKYAFKEVEFLPG